MITQKIKYTNPFNGQPEEVEAHFHLNKNDIVMLEAAANDAGHADVEAQFNAIVQSGNNVRIFNIFKELILTAYGKRQGSRFVKSQAIRDDFEGSEEFSELIWYLIEHEDELGAFFANLLSPATKERAPMLTDQNKAAEAESNVFNAPLQDPGELTHQMPPVAERGPIPPDDQAPTPTDISKPRLLQQVELEKMNFTDVMKGVEDGRWRLPQ